MKTTTHPLRRSILLTILALTVLPSMAQTAVLVKDYQKENGDGDSPVCREILDTINATPDFFERATHEGYAYILYHSPFKRAEIKKIPKHMVYPIMMERIVLRGQERIYEIMNLTNPCKRYP